MIRSTQMMLDPMTHAACASAYGVVVETGSGCPTDATYAGHNPSACIIIERHLGRSQADVTAICTWMISPVLSAPAAQVKQTYMGICEVSVMISND